MPAAATTKAATPEALETNELFVALLKAKQQFGPVLKDKMNPAFKSKYADLGAVLEAVEPALLANGILVVQQVQSFDDVMYLDTSLIHVGGLKIGSRYKVTPMKKDPQGEGSAITYARRYSLLSLLSIAPEDDDGNAAARKAPAEPATDWNKKIKETQTVEGVQGLYKLAKSKGELTETLITQMTERSNELNAASQLDATPVDDDASNEPNK